MADAPLKKPKAVSDWLNRPRPEKLDATEQRQKLWEALSDFIHSNGGHVVSAPGARNLRIEISQGSPLPAKLTELGYDPRFAGIGTRITSGQFMPVEILEIKLG